MPVDFETFLTERRYLKGICERTVDYYRDCFRQFGNNPTPNEDDLKQFVIRIRERGMKETSCNDYIRGINAYLKRAGSSLKIQKVKEPKQVLPTYSEQDLQRLVQWKPNDWYGRRLHLLVLTLIDMGNYLCTDPPIVGVGVANRTDQPFVPKDTARNIRRTGEFVVNVVTEDIAGKMNLCATDFPREMSEVELAGFTTVPSQKVKPPRLAEAHAALECREYTTLEIGHSRIILGRVVAVYVEDRFVDPSGPYIQAEELHAIGRMNGLGNYVRTREAFMTISRISYEEWKTGKR